MAVMPSRVVVGRRGRLEAQAYDRTHLANAMLEVLEQVAASGRRAPETQTMASAQG